MLRFPIDQGRRIKKSAPLQRPEAAPEFSNPAIARQETKRQDFDLELFIASSLCGNISWAEATRKPTIFCLRVALVLNILFDSQIYGSRAVLHLFWTPRK